MNREGLFDLCHPLVFGVRPGLLLASLFETVDLNLQSRILRVDIAQDLPLPEGLEELPALLQHAGPAGDRVDFIPPRSHLLQGLLEALSGWILLFGLFQDRYFAVQVRFRHNFFIDSGHVGGYFLPLHLFNVILQNAEHNIVGIGRQDRSQMAAAAVKLPSARLRRASASCDGQQIALGSRPLCRTAGIPLLVPETCYTTRADPIRARATSY